MILDDDSLSALEWAAICALLAERTNAAPAARALRSWRPLPDQTSAHEALAEVAEGMGLVGGEGAFPAPFVDDQDRTLRALGVEGAMLDGPALISAARTFEGVRKLAAWLRRDPDRWPKFAARFRSAPAEPELERLVLSAFDAETRIVDQASPELKRLRGEVRQHRSTLIDQLARLIAELPHVLVAADSRPTVRDGRYVVPLRREALSEVPGIVHDESSSGATVFLEPHATVERNNALRQAELAVRREEERILRELTAVLAERRDALEHAARLALHAETVLARARYALDVNGSPPVLGGGTLQLSDARHPLLVARQEAVGTPAAVPLTLELGPDERTLVVTGPNTGGKTVLLKTVGAVVLMAQSGVIPPVGPGTRIPWHGALFADIGDTQSIAQDLSTFTAHLTRLKAAWDAADRESLILVDEIGASTDPAEGAALAAALLEAWTERGARTIVTTHYHALKVLAAGTAGLVNGSLAYDLERNIPRYRFVQGVPGRSFGLELAERWGFGAVVARARARVEKGVQDVEGVIDRLASEERGHREARLALEAERKAIGEAESARARRVAAEAEARRDAAERRLAELEDRLTRLRDEVRAQGRKLRERAAALSEAQAAAETSRVLAREAERAAEELRAEREALAGGGLARPIAVGDRVRIPRYDVVGEVVAIDRSDDTAAVQAGQVRITCRASECEPVDAAMKSAWPVVEPGGGAEDSMLEIPPVALEVDLRGLAADEIAYPVAGALERAYHGGNPAIRFIHGKGSGILRARVAEILRKHPYVAAFRLGHWNEGGDGVTIASIAHSSETAER